MMHPPATHEAIKPSTSIIFSRDYGVLDDQTLDLLCYPSQVHHPSFPNFGSPSLLFPDLLCCPSALRLRVQKAKQPMFQPQAPAHLIPT